MRRSRGSKYRGVSKNGTKWQISVVSGQLKKYIGAIEDQEAAGTLYDKYAIILHGLKVSLNQLLCHIDCIYEELFDKLNSILKTFVVLKQAKTNFSYTKQ